MAGSNENNNMVRRMKLFGKSTFVLFVLLWTGLLFITGCEPLRPPYLVPNFYPAVAGDGSGGIVAVYHLSELSGKESYTSHSYIQRISSVGERLLGEKGIPIDLELDQMVSPTTLVSDGQGNYLLIWKSPNGIWACKIDLTGNLLWGEGEVKISSLTRFRDYKVFGNNGVAIVAWVNTGGELFIQKIDADGHLLWPDAPVLSQTIGFDLSTDHQGNIFIIWRGLDSGISIRKIDSQGQSQWNKDILLLNGKSAPFTNAQPWESDFWVISDGAGGCITGWKDMTGSYPLNLQRIETGGNVLWSVQKLPTNEKFLDLCRIVEDGSGGTLVFWQSNRSIYAQHIDSDGIPLWEGENGLLVDSGVYLPDYQVSSGDFVSDGNGGAIISWISGTEVGRIPYSQRLDRSGKKLWNDQGKIVRSTSTSHVQYNRSTLMTEENLNGVIAFGIARTEESHAFVQKISTDGTFPWGNEGVTLDAWRSKE
jgi:hypothetical protein